MWRTEHIAYRAKFCSIFLHQQDFDGEPLFENWSLPTSFVLEKKRSKHCCFKRFLVLFILLYVDKDHFCDFHQNNRH